MERTCLITGSRPEVAIGIVVRADQRCARPLVCAWRGHRVGQPLLIAIRPPPLGTSIGVWNQFAHTGRGTPVSVDEIAIVALLAGIEDAIAAATRRRLVSEVYVACLTDNHNDHDVWSRAAEAAGNSFSDSILTRGDSGESIGAVAAGGRGGNDHIIAGSEQSVRTRADQPDRHPAQSEITWVLDTIAVGILEHGARQGSGHRRCRSSRARARDCRSGRRQRTCWRHCRGAHKRFGRGRGRGCRWRRGGGRSGGDGHTHGGRRNLGRRQDWRRGSRFGWCASRGCRAGCCCGWIGRGRGAWGCCRGLGGAPA